ncbi:hypothetical protein ACFV27_37300 [Streptomyces antimycoticus]|uniref:hypothetical protein n=1 Tax=Streptomyces antimycoticus TaxID=68175 RepID=UPI0036A48600
MRSLIQARGLTELLWEDTALMRRPALHHPLTSPALPGSGWSHPYAPSPFVFYADGGDPPAGEPPAADPAPKPGPPPSRTFSQDEVAALAAKEKAQGERAGARAALEKFAADNGFSNVDDAKAFIEEARKAREAQLSEQEKREQALAKREQEIADREAAAVARERNASRRAVLVGLGATGDDLEDAAALLRVADDADDDAVQEAATALKERRPELFGVAPATAPGGPPPAPGGAPAGGPPSRQAPAGKPGDRGREMLIRRGKLPAA